MADRFGFNLIASKIKSIERTFLNDAVELARDEMVENISTQSSKESGNAYPPLTYYVDWKPKNPPRLVLTGELLSEIRNNSIRIFGNTASLVIDPIDEKGIGYASYHQDGENQYKSEQEFKAEFVTQSSSLASKQVNLLKTLVDKAFV